MYDKSKVQEIERRQNKGLEDITNTNKKDNGVFELDEKFPNGYHVYIPYGISFDLVNALESGIQAMISSNNELNELISEIEAENGLSSDFLQDYKNKVEENLRYIKILNAFSEIPELAMFHK